MGNQQKPFFKIYFAANRGKPKLSNMGPVSPIDYRYSIYKQLVCTSIWNCDSPSCSSVSDRQKRKSKVIAKNATSDIEESDGSFFILLFGFLCEHMPKIAVACLNAVHKVEQVGQLASTFPVFRYFVGQAYWGQSGGCKLRGGMRTVDPLTQDPPK